MRDNEVNEFCASEVSPVLEFGDLNKDQCPQFSTGPLQMEVKSRVLRQQGRSIFHEVVTAGLTGNIELRPLPVSLMRLYSNNLVFELFTYIP